MSAVLLLSGSLRPHPLERATRRAVLDLPVGDSCTLLGHWRSLAELLAAANDDRVPLRIIVNEHATRPRPGDGAVSVEPDPAPLRGAGGVLRDVSASYADDDYLLVAASNQLLLRPLDEIVRDLAACDAEVALAAHADGTPVSLMLVRPRCVRSIAAVGFVDLKEQALPQIARAHDVRVVRYGHAVAMPIRTTESYIAALRHRHARPTRGDDAPLSGGGPFREDWRPSFGVVECDDAAVGAMIHDSVVLEGGRVDAGGIVVRSVVCPGGHVRRGAAVVDTVVRGNGA